MAIKYIALGLFSLCITIFIITTQLNVDSYPTGLSGFFVAVAAMLTSFILHVLIDTDNNAKFISKHYK